MLLTPAALLFKGYRWWRGRGPELSHRAATWLVVAYFLFFPVDLWWVSRAISADAQNPGLFAALLAAIHLMLFAIIVRLFSARTTRDCLFLALLAFSAMLASAILTVDTAFIGFFLVFLALGVSTFVGLEMRRGAEGATWSPLESGTPAARRLHTALGVTSAAVAVSAVIAGAVIFLVLPALPRRIPLRLQSAAGADLRLQRRSRTRTHRRDPAERRRGHAHPRRGRPFCGRRTCTGAASPSPALTAAAGTPKNADRSPSARTPDDWILLRPPTARVPRPRSSAAALHHPARTAGLRRHLRGRRARADSRAVHQQRRHGRKRFPPHLPAAGQDRLAGQSFSQFRQRALRRRLGDSAGSRRRAAPGPALLSQLHPRDVPAAPQARSAHPGPGPADRRRSSQRRSTRPGPSNATCPQTTPTLSTWPARRPPIRWRIFFSSGAPATANISPRP